MRPRFLQVERTRCEGAPEAHVWLGVSEPRHDRHADLGEYRFVLQEVSERLGRVGSHHGALVDVVESLGKRPGDVAGPAEAEYVCRRRSPLLVLSALEQPLDAAQGSRVVELNERGCGSPALSFVANG